MASTLDERIARRAIVKGECLLWHSPGGSYRRVRRKLLERLGRTLGPGEQVRATCGATDCVRVEHLVIIVPREPTPREPKAPRLRCHVGHAYAEFGRIDSRGAQRCLACAAATARERYRRRRERVGAPYRGREAVRV